MCTVEGDTFISCLLMADEAHFDISGDVNKQNCIVLVQENLIRKFIGKE